MKRFLPDTLIKWDCVVHMDILYALSTLKLLTANPLLLDTSKNINWKSGYPVKQQAYLGCEGEKAIALNVDCF